MCAPLNGHHRTWRLSKNGVRIRAQPSEQAGLAPAPDHQEIGVPPRGNIADGSRYVSDLHQHLARPPNILLQFADLLPRGERYFVAPLRIEIDAAQLDERLRKDVDHGQSRAERLRKVARPFQDSRGSFDEVDRAQNPPEFD